MNGRADHTASEVIHVSQEQPQLDDGQRKQKVQFVDRTYQRDGAATYIHPFVGFSRTSGR
jgi:hypothetical protein